MLYFYLSEPVFSFRDSEYRVNENSGTVTVTVVMSGEYKDISRTSQSFQELISFILSDNYFIIRRFKINLN